MREMDGVELTRRIKQLSREHPVVMVSGMTEVNNGGSENLADAFLAKPFSQDQVIQALRAALDNF
jgi:CheY-like chemotaxis protein